jgi:hypothetical protein
MKRVAAGAAALQHTDPRVRRSLLIRSGEGTVKGNDRPDAGNAKHTVTEAANPSANFCH